MIVPYRSAYDIGCISAFFYLFIYLFFYCWVHSHLAADSVNSLSRLRSRVLFLLCGSAAAMAGQSSVSSGSSSNNNTAGQITRRLLAGVLGVLIVTGAGNYLLFKLLYSVYGQEYSYFVSQGINLLYLVYGGAVLAPIMLFTDKITPEMRRFPQYKYIFMGLLDSLGTFLAAMGAVGTPGHYQVLLNQTLIPFCMLLGRIVLGMRFHPWQLVGALLIIVGAMISVIPGIIQPDPNSTTTIKWYACLIYFASNIPMACSAIYKEYGFRMPI